MSRTLKLTKVAQTALEARIQKPCNVTQPEYTEGPIITHWKMPLHLNCSSISVQRNLQKNYNHLQFKLWKSSVKSNLSSTCKPYTIMGLMLFFYKITNFLRRKIQISEDVLWEKGSKAQTLLSGF